MNLSGFRFKTKYMYILIIVLLLSGGFALRNFPFTQGNLSEDSPAVRTTYDAFYHIWYAKAVYDQEDARYWPDFANYGIKTVWLQPPLLYTFAGSFAKLTSMPFYRLFYALICFLGIWIPFQIYVLFRKYFGENAAILGLAFALFPTWNWMMFYVMGFSMDILAFLVVPFALFLVLEYLKKANVIYPILFGLVFGFSALAHTFQAVFALMMFGVLLAVLLMLRRLSVLRILKFSILSGVIFFAMTLNYIPLLVKGYGGGGEGLTDWISFGSVKHAPEYMWPVSYHWILILGFVVFGLVLFTKHKSFMKNGKITLLSFCIIGAAFFLLLYLGFDGLRVIRHQFMAYNLIVFLAAIGYGSIIGFVKNRYKVLLTILLLASVSIFFFQNAYPRISDINTQTMFTDDKWEAIKFIRDNTPENSSIFSFYGYFHAFQEFTERVSFTVDFGREYTADTYNELCTGKMPDKFAGTYTGENYYNINRSQLVVGRSTFLNLETIPSPKKKITSEKIEDFDYLLTQYSNTQIQPCIDLFIQNITSRGYPIVYKNPTMVVFEVKDENK